MHSNLIGLSFLNSEGSVRNYWGRGEGDCFCRFFENFFTRVTIFAARSEARSSILFGEPYSMHRISLFWGDCMGIVCINYHWFGDCMGIVCINYRWSEVIAHK